MIDTILFDLDGTLLPMDQDLFVEKYLSLLAQHMAPYDYPPKALVKAVWEGTRRMIANDGGKTNEAVFWDCFRECFGPRAEEDRGMIDEFYNTGFAGARVTCGFNPDAAGLIALLKRRGIRCILATNPLFPRTATLQRIRWAGLDPADFDWITTYENARFCKPNPDYYREILEKIGKKPEQCLMVGNDGREDLAAEQVGVKAFLLTDHLLHGEEAEGHTLRGNFREMTAYLESLTGAGMKI